MVVLLFKSLKKIEKTWSEQKNPNRINNKLLMLNYNSNFKLLL